MNCTKPETLQWTQDVRKDTNCVRVKMVTDDFEVAALNPKLESRNPEASNLLLSGTHPDAGVHSLRRQEGIPTLSLSLSLSFSVARQAWTRPSTSRLLWKGSCPSRNRGKPLQSCSRPGPLC